MALRSAYFTICLAPILLAGCAKGPKLSTSSPEALSFYEDGVVQTDKFYYAEATVSFERALKSDSTFAMAWGRLAMVKLNTRNQPEANQDIARALQYVRSATPREQLYVQMWNSRIHEAYKDAAKYADSLIAAYPDDKEAYLFRGNLCELNKKFDAAIQSYRKAVEIDSGYALAVMSLGYAYSNIGEQEKAVQQMQRYINMEPDAADPRASYADLLVRVGRYDEALDQYRKSLELKPEYWYAIRSIGAVYAIQGRLNEANDQYRRALKELPGSAQLEGTRLTTDAYLNMLRGKYDEAEKQYTEAQKLDSSELTAAFGKVNALIRSRRMEEGQKALEDLRRDLEHRGLQESAVMLDFYIVKSRLLAGENRFEEATAACDSAFNNSSWLTRGAAYRQQAEIFFREKQYEPALDALEGALRVNPNSPEALLTLAKVYHAMGDRRMTAEIGGRLLLLWKDADRDYRNLADLRALLPPPGAT